MAADIESEHPDPAVLRQVFDLVMDAVIVADRSFHVVQLNPAAEDMFGTCSAAFIGRPLSTLIPVCTEAKFAPDAAATEPPDQKC